jgi:hypothetical protein
MEVLEMVPAGPEKFKFLVHQYDFSLIHLHFPLPHSLLFYFLTSFRANNPTVPVLECRTRLPTILLIIDKRWKWREEREKRKERREKREGERRKRREREERRRGEKKPFVMSFDTILECEWNDHISERSLTKRKKKEKMERRVRRTRCMMSKFMLKKKRKIYLFTR